jgi:hypothetical protein
MNKLCAAATLGLSLAWGVSICTAQNVSIPFRQIERDAQLPATLMVPEVAISRSNEAYLFPPASSGALYVKPTYKRPRILDSKFFLVNGLHLGMAALDVALTQHCIANQHCTEGNPLMPSSFAGQLAVDSALVGAGTLVSYRLKKQDSKLWWLSPVIGSSAHTAGAITGFRNR